MAVLFRKFSLFCLRLVKASLRRCTEYWSKPSTAASKAHHAPGGKCPNPDSQLKNTAQPHVKYSGHLWVAQEAPCGDPGRYSLESQGWGCPLLGWVEVGRVPAMVSRRCSFEPPPRLGASTGGFPGEAQSMPVSLSFNDDILVKPPVAGVGMPCVLTQALTRDGRRGPP